VAVEQVMVICARRFMMDAIKARIDEGALIIGSHGRGRSPRLPVRPA